jgi:hypothetical protein
MFPDIVASALELVSGFYFCISYCHERAGNLRWIIFPDIILESVLVLIVEICFQTFHFNDRSLI